MPILVAVVAVVVVVVRQLCTTATRGATETGSSASGFSTFIDCYSEIECLAADSGQ